MFKFHAPLRHLQRRRRKSPGISNLNVRCYERSNLSCSRGWCFGCGHCLTGLECGALVVLLNTAMDFRDSQTQEIYRPAEKPDAFQVRVYPAVMGKRVRFEVVR